MLHTEGYSESTEMIDTVNILPLARFEPTNDPLCPSQLFFSHDGIFPVLKCFAQGHNTLPPVWPKPGTPRSEVKHSTTALL